MITHKIIPGEFFIEKEPLELNAGRIKRQIDVTNDGDRPIQIGSHFHFFEVNDSLSFDRPLALGFRLNIPSGTAVRFEPGQTRRVELVALTGNREVYGFAGRVMGKLPDPELSDLEDDQS